MASLSSPALDSLESATDSFPLGQVNPSVTGAHADARGSSSATSMVAMLATLTATALLAPTSVVPSWMDSAPMSYKTRLCAAAFTWTVFLGRYELRGKGDEDTAQRSVESRSSSSRFANIVRRLKPSPRRSVNFECDLSSCLDSLHARPDDLLAGRSALASRGSTPLLDSWTERDVADALDRSKATRALAAAGYDSLTVAFDTTDPWQHRMVVSTSDVYGTASGFLINALLRRRDHSRPVELGSYQLLKRFTAARSWQALYETTGELRAPYLGIEAAHEVLALYDEVWSAASARSKASQTDSVNLTQLDWCQMHAPGAAVTRPLLPGQQFPGLGCGKLVGAAMIDLAIKSDRTDALINQPFYWHNAVMYAKFGWRHLDPVYEAYFRWLNRQLEPVIQAHGLCFVSWAITNGHMRRVVEVSDASGGWQQVSSRLERWSPSDQVFPTGRAVKTFLDSRRYLDLLDKYSKTFAEDGGANLSGVHVAAVEKDGRVKRARIVIDMEGCSELWRYSTDRRWARRDPETGRFPLL